MSAEDHDDSQFSDSQPATQPLDDPAALNYNDDSSEDEAPQAKPYGFLFPLAYNFRVIELINRSTSVGRRYCMYFC